MSGVLVGEVIEHAERLRAVGALGGPKVADRNLIALLVVAEGCREETRSGFVSRERVAGAVGSVRTASRALADLIALGRVELVAKGNRSRDGRGLASRYRLASFDSIDGPPKVAPRSPSIDGPPKVAPRTVEATESTGHLGPIDVPLEADRRATQGGPLPVEVSTPVEVSSPSSSSVSNAGARENEPIEPAARTLIEPPDSETQPLAWLDRNLPMGFLTGERAEAEQMLAVGTRPGPIRYELLRRRRQPDRRERSM